jgi:hypothetical protein
VSLENFRRGLGITTGEVCVRSFIGLLLASAASAIACGDFFCGDSLLLEGDSAVLVAPTASFVLEVARTRGNRTPFRADSAPAQRTVGAAVQSGNAEADDLRTCLRKAKLDEDTAHEVLQAHAVLRDKLSRYVDDVERWNSSRPWHWEDDQIVYETPAASAPELPLLDTPANLPAEFAYYLEGAISWHNPADTEKMKARQAWEKILELPEAERRFKSTWAAYMLGKHWEQKDPEKAATYFAQVRSLARKRYSDSLQLAASSLGLEARTRLKQKNYEAAIELYLEQLTTGDESVTNSLRFAAEAAIKAEPEKLVSLAKNPRTQRVITAYLISSTTPRQYWSNKAKLEAMALNWLEAVESADIKDLESAEKLAVAAYKYNAMDQARRWIKRAGHSVMTQWLQAKLLLHAGKQREAAELLSRVVQAFPPHLADTNVLSGPWHEHTLFVEDIGWQMGPVSAGGYARAELGLLQLSRGEYAQALDGLLNNGFWRDAAYIAERVLTLDELKSYVDHFWPPTPADLTADEKDQDLASIESIAKNRQDIRYLLARRLLRSGRGNESRPYFPDEWLSQYDALAQALTLGWDASVPQDQRAEALLTAAYIARTNGLELVGTEVEPDWRLRDGDFELTSGRERGGPETASALVAASKDELSRATNHNADPETRWHYRYQAASLTWEAARSMPDNNDRTALMLWQGGWWLKDIAPETADLFYKALVRRNRQTELGAEADRRRWFPKLDEQGRILPRTQRPSQELTPTTEENDEDSNDVTPSVESASLEMIPQFAAVPEGGYICVIRKGDSIASVARETARLGLSKATSREIFQANPGLNAARLKVGQKVFVPATVSNPEERESQTSHLP